MKKTTITTTSARSKSKKPPCRFKEPDSTCNQNNNNNTTESIANVSGSACQQRSKSPGTPSPSQIPVSRSGAEFSKKRKQSSSPMKISAAGIGFKIPEEKARPTPPPTTPSPSLPPGVDPKQLFSSSSTPPITACPSSTRRKPLKSPRRHKIQLYNARQNRSTARSASPYLCEVVKKKTKPKNDAYQEIYVSDREYRLLRIALNLQPLPEPLRPRQNFRKTLFGYIAVPNLDDLPLDLNSALNSKSSCGLRRSINNNNNNTKNKNNLQPPQKIKSNDKIKSLENPCQTPDLKYPLNTSSSSNSSSSNSSNHSSSTSITKSHKKTANASLPSSSKKSSKTRKCLKSQKHGKSKSKSKSLKLNFSSDSESSIKTDQKAECTIEKNVEIDDIQDGVEKWAWRHNLLELVETSASPFVLTLPQEEMLEMLAKESQLKNKTQGNGETVDKNSKPSIPAICDTTSEPEPEPDSENEQGLEQIEKPALSMDSDCSQNQIRNLNLNHPNNYYYENNGNGNDNGPHDHHHHHYENLLGENMKNSIFAASETCMILMHTLFNEAMKDPTIARNLKGSVPFQNFVESSSGLEALENAAVIFEMAGRRIKSYAEQMKKKFGTGTEYSEFSTVDDDHSANVIEEEMNENSSQICDVTLIETKDDVAATTNFGHFGSCWSDDTFHVTLSSTPDSALLLQQIKCRDREFSLSYIGSSRKVHSLISSSRSPAQLVTLSTPPLQLLEMIERTSSYTVSRLTASKYHFLLAYDKLTGVIRKCLAGKHGFHLATSTPSASSSSIKISSKASKRAQLKLRGLNTFSGIIVQVTRALMDLFKKLYQVLEILKQLESILKLKFPETASAQTPSNNCEDKVNIDSKTQIKDAEGQKSKGEEENENDKENEDLEKERENTKNSKSDTNPPPLTENESETEAENSTAQIENNNDIENESISTIKSFIRPLTFSATNTFHEEGENNNNNNNQSRQKFLSSILQDIDNILEMGKISLEGLHIKNPDVKVGKGLKKTLDVLWKALVQMDKQHDVDFGTLVISMVCNVEMVIARFTDHDPSLNVNSNNNNNNSSGESRSDLASPATSSQNYSNSLYLPLTEFGLGIIPLSRSFGANLRKLEENILNIYSLCKRMDILASHLASKSLHKLKKTQALEKARMMDKQTLNQAQNRIRIPWYKRFRHKKSTENIKTCSMIMLNTIHKANEEV